LPPGKRLVVAGTRHEPGGVGEPTRQGSAESDQKSIGLIAEQQPQELDKGDCIQNELCHTERDREQEHEQSTLPELPGFGSVISLLHVHCVLPSVALQLPLDGRLATIFRRDGRFADMVMARLAASFEAPR
jgi:hypothetical protein